MEAWIYIGILMVGVIALRVYIRRREADGSYDTGSGSRSRLGLSLGGMMSRKRR